VFTALKRKRLPVKIPVIEMIEIGAGGEVSLPSAPWPPEVGRESAGPDPGPACYARGGQNPR